MALFVATAFAAPPTVDFTFPPYVSVNTDINFFPIITASPDLNYLFWSFPDGNRNYSTGYYALLADNFGNGNLNNPVPWTIGAGAFSETDGFLQNGGGIDQWIYTPYNISFNDQNLSWDWNVNVTGMANAANYACFASKSAAQYGGNAYGVWVRVGQAIKLVSDCSAGTAILTSSTTVVSGTTYHIGVKRFTDGNWAMWVNGDYAGDAIDNSRTDANYVVWSNGGVASALKIGDFNITTGTAIPIDIDLNQLVRFTTTGLKRVTLMAGNADGNVTVAYDFNVYGYFRIRFYDENTFLSYVPSSVKVNGVEQALTGNLLDYPLVGLYTNTDLTIVSSGTGKATRTFYFPDINENSVVDINAFLLDTNKGKTVSFRFFKLDETSVFSNARVIAFRAGIDANYAGINLTNSNGDVSFFLNTDANYVFSIDQNLDGKNDYNYSPVLLTVYIPKEELNGENISPFIISFSGLLEKDFNNLSANKTVTVFSNTKDFYKLTISTQNEGYSTTRSYSIRYKANPLTASLQPYLVSDSSGGFSSSFKTLDAYTRNSLSGILVQLYGNTTNGQSLLESKITDSAGLALISLALNKDYNISFSFSTIDQEPIGSSFINAQSSTYFFLLDLSSIDTNGNAQNGLDVNYLQIGVITSDINNGFDLNWTAKATENGITQILWQVYTNDGNLLENKIIIPTNGMYYSDSNHFQLNYLDYNTIVISSILIQYNGYDFNFVKQFAIYSQQGAPIRNAIEGIRDLFGGIGTVLLALFIALSVHGFFASNRPETGTNGLFFIVATVTGIFVYFGTISVFNFGAACLFGFAGWIYANRG